MEPLRPSAPASLPAGFWFLDCIEIPTNRRYNPYYGACPACNLSIVRASAAPLDRFAFAARSCRAFGRERDIARRID